MLADSSDFGLLGDQSSQKKLDYLPWTLINHHAKFDNASFILCGEIRDHTKNTNSNRYIHTLPINTRG